MRDFKRKDCVFVEPYHVVLTCVPTVSLAPPSCPALNLTQSGLCFCCLAGLSQDPPDGVNASPHPDNIMQWNAVIFGPEETVWDGGELLCRPSGLCGFD